MDYTEKDLAFKIKKALRYIYLYGFNRTLIKVKGQYHMKKAYDVLPPQGKQHSKKMRIGIVGCGNFAYTNIAYYLKKNYGGVIKACMDIDINKAASLYEGYKLNYYTDDADKIINDPDIDILYIASNHATHAEYAIKALNANKNVHIEKPHVVNEDQLERLTEAAKKSEGKILSIGFNRPKSVLGKKIRSAMDSQSGPAMLNWFIVGHELVRDHWYFKKEEGGRILGNLCHWTDFIFNLVDSSDVYPIKINPTRYVESDCNISVSYVFGDGTIAVITFSVKGHMFEGVREELFAHKGNVMISMNNFKALTIELGENKNKTSLYHHDHGHEASIVHSFISSQAPDNKGSDIKYVWETANLFLMTKKALEENKTIVIDAYDRQL